MAENELRIDVVVNDADLEKLSASAQRVAQSIQELIAQFGKGGMSSQELATGVQSLVDAFLKSYPGITGQTAALTELAGVQKNLAAAARESGAIIQDASTKAGSSAEFYRVLSAEQTAAALTANTLKTATGQLSQSIAALAPAASSGAAGVSRLAAAAGEAGIAVGASGAEIKAAQVSYGEAGTAASELAGAMVENSTAVQVTGTRYAELARDLKVATVALDEAEEAMLQTGLTEEQNSQVIAAHSKALAEHRMLQMQTTAAEKDLKNALAESYTEQVKLAAARADTAAQTQAASQTTVDAKDKEAASYERQRAAEAELAAREADTIRRLQEKAEAAKNTAAVNEQVAASSQNAAAAARNSSASYMEAAKSTKQLSQAGLELSLLMSGRQGMAFKDAVEMLGKIGYTTKQVAKAQEELGLATAATAAETEVATAKITNLERAEAQGAVRMAANMAGIGQLGYSLARIGALSQTLAPILAAAFPVIAVFAFIDVLENLSKKISEYSELSLKAAEDTAKFEREMNKGAEAVAQMGEKVAGLAGPLAEAAERMANLDSRTLDLTASTKATNAEIDNSIGFWKKLAETLAKDVVDSYYAFLSLSAVAARETKIFNEQIDAQVKTFADLPAAIKKTSDELERLKTMRAAAATFWDPATTENVIKDLDKLIATEDARLTDLNNRQKALDLERLAEQESMNEKLTTAQVSADDARIAQEEAFAKMRLKLGQTTEMEFLTQQIHFDEERTVNALRALDERERILNERRAAAAAAGKPTDIYAAEEAALAEQRTKIRTEEATRVQQQTFDINQKILADTLAVDRALIDSSESVAMALERQREAQENLRGKFSLADTPAAVQAAAKELIDATNRSLDIQLQKYNQLAVEAIKKVPEAPMPKAELGTKEFGEEVAGMKEYTTEVKNDLIKLNTDIMVARANAAAKNAETANEEAAKIREINREALTNQLADLKDQQIAIREEYQQQESTLKNLLTERKINEQTFYDASVALAKTNLAELQEIYDKQTLDLVDARAKDIVTEEQFQKKLLAIWKEEEIAHKQMMTREEQAAKEAIDKEEAEIKKVTDKISSEFVKMGQTLLTTHTSVGRAAMQLGRDLELYIIEQGIKKVVEKWTTSLLQMLAEHNSILTKILGIHVLTQQQEAAATEISQAEQTAAVKAGQAAQQESTMITSLKSIANKAADAAAGAYDAMAGIPVIGPALGAAAAAATFAAVMAYTAIVGAEGGMVVPSAAGGMVGSSIQSQPVLVHSGEIVTTQATLRSLSAAPSAAAGMIARVSTDQISNLAPGTVVVPRIMASGLIAATGGSVSTVPGIPPPLGLHEQPQRLPAEMSGIIRDVINVRGGEGGFLSAAGGVSIPMIAGGPSVQSAAAGIAVPAAHAPISLPAMHAPTIGGATTISHAASRTQVNNLRLEYHSHGPAGVQKDELVGLIRRALRTGALG